MKSGGSSLDAIVKSCMKTEKENGQRTVGLGGWPDRDGVVTLDAAVMPDDGRAGSVAFVRGVAHPIKLAQLVMEKTPHVMLVGEGAQQFAKEQGIKVKEMPLDSVQEKKWKEWLSEKRYSPKINVENHDTISMIALDKAGNMTVGSTTSGLAFKMHGRVGDSPIIGSGLYAEKGVGGAVCTGLGEALLRTVGAHSIVEAIRYGRTPQEACDLLIQRIIKLIPGSDNYQVGVLALDYKGNVGAASVQKGFSYAIGNSEGNKLAEASAAINKEASIQLAMKVKQ